MKTAFNISPSSSESNSLHLLIEAGSSTISMIWFTQNPFAVKGLAVYNVSSSLSSADVVALLEAQKEFITGLGAVTICYDLKESLLIPGAYHKDSVDQKAMSLMFGESDDSALNSDLITSAEIHNQYRIPKDIEKVLSKQFPTANTFHATSLQLEQLHRETDLLYCIIFHDVLKVILFKEGKLQIVQQFSYISPEDVAYHLLNVCEQHTAKPSVVPLRLSGMIDEQSRLYQELYKYFLYIGFESTAKGIYAANELQELPAHFFSHLTALALCV